MARRNRVPVGLALAGACLLLASCGSTPRPAPVVDRSPQGAVASAAAKPAARPAPQPPQADWRPQTYIVKRGDTLFSIALDHGLDYRDLAAWNGVDNPGLIQAGRALRLTPPPATSASPAAAGPAASGAVVTPLRSVAPIEAKPVAPPGAAAPGGLAAPAAAGVALLKTEPKAVKLPYSEQAYAQMQAQTAQRGPGLQPANIQLKPEDKPGPAPGTGDEDVVWAWPVTGKLLSQFNEAASSKGIDISGKMGQPVFAAAPGVVIYTGSDIRGYGKFIVVKHAGGYSSVYAHNSEIVVKKDQKVAKGEKIAEMGSTDADQVKLHFEIRRLGKPVDPARLLPAL